MVRSRANERPYRKWVCSPLPGHPASWIYARGAIVGKHPRPGPVAELVGIEGGVVSGVFSLESSGVEAPDWRPRHDER